ncbi:MAG TPA: 5,10-methenyltetrahydromethanopterin hydrogenase cofactor biosynthesis protein HmdC [Methanocorpusculum sp.]|nr:5,10-methenyltetrahydromethanopterin hydrogenase cofactor biosynthesis protein HmdC [Methanocorpusculum sp.]HJK80990.1 5,10-methenyltetrahydromethanopterin hydrogenase cofactor biosynthesis protein HmdC [Methanocorpusculum sp.]
METLLHAAARSFDSAWELSKLKKNPEKIVEAISSLSREETMQLGMNCRQFPIGCDLTEVFVGTCASDLSMLDIAGNCQVSDTLGASIHICAYAFSDIAEAHGMRGIDLMRKVRETTEVPLDLDHFGLFGPMRFPQEITGCPGQCYNQGPPYDGCPRGRIHARLLEKEKEALADKEEWVKLSSSVAVNLTCVQGGEEHAAPLDEAEDVAALARKYGKGVEAILFVGDGYEDLIAGFTAGMKMGADVFVIEGGPFNRAKDRLDAFSRAVAVARILAPGKVVATNGAYEDECRVGLRTGLNAVISGFPRNHHGYMCGYAPGSAKRGNFGLPRVMQIIREEAGTPWTHAPIQKGEMKALARAVKVVGPEHAYPRRIGFTTLGDAHWACLAQTPLYARVTVENTVEDLVRRADAGELGERVALLGGRFVSWAVARALEGKVDHLVIGDADSRVEQVTLENLREAVSTDISGGGSDDRSAAAGADAVVVCSTVPAIAGKISKTVGGHPFLFV